MLARTRFQGGTSSLMQWSMHFVIEVLWMGSFWGEKK